MYRTPQGSGWLEGMQFSLNATNLLNHDPPFVDNQGGYDAFNIQPLGRVVSVDISKRW